VDLEVRHTILMARYNSIDIDRYSYLYIAYKSKESLGASVAKKICNVKLVGDLAYFGKK